MRGQSPSAHQCTAVHGSPRRHDLHPQGRLYPADRRRHHGHHPAEGAEALFRPGRRAEYADQDRHGLVGGGKIAFFLAKILLDSGISVKIIEKRLERCEFLSEKLPAATVIHGDGTDRELLDEEGLSSCGAFASLTGMDEENILLSLHAGRHSKARLFTKVNRVNFEEVISHLPIGTIVRPKQTTAELIGQYTRAMQNSMGSNVETLHQLGGAEALEFRVAAHHLTGIPLQDMPIRPDVLLCCIQPARAAASSRAATTSFRRATPLSSSLPVRA